MHTKQQKTKMRRSGPSVLRKAADLGKKGNVFSFAVYYNAITGRMEARVYLPEGEKLPDLNRLVVLALQRDRRKTSTVAENTSITHDAKSTETVIDRTFPAQRVRHASQYSSAKTIAAADPAPDMEIGPEGWAAGDESPEDAEPAPAAKTSTKSIISRLFFGMLLV